MQSLPVKQQPSLISDGHPTPFDHEHPFRISRTTWNFILMSSATLERRTIEPSQPAAMDVCAVLGELGESCQTQSEYYRESLQAVARHFASPYAAIRITHLASTLDERSHDESVDTICWESVVEPLLLDCQANNIPITRLFKIEGTAYQVAVMAAPVCDKPHRPIGALAMVTRCDQADLAKVYLAELGAMVALLATHASHLGPNRATVSDDDRLKRSVVKAADYESLHELAFAVTNSLKNKFECDRVTLGQVKEGTIGILSVSGLDNLYPKSPGIRHIRQAMEECLDLGETICWQDQDKWAEKSVATGHRLHRRWHEEIGGNPVASLPLFAGKKCVAIVSMSRAKSKPFMAEELDKIREATEPFAPAIQLVAKADRPLFAHAIDTVRSGLRWLIVPKTPQRKLLVSMALTAFLYFCFATIGYEVTVPVRIAPTEIRNYAAPFEATIKACHVEVGDEVSAGQLLYELETTDLQLQRDQLDSELAVLRLQANHALVADDQKGAAIAGAQMRVIQIQRMITNEYIEQADVRAPSNGTVVAGELKKRVGQLVPMGEPMLEFVPQGDWAIELEIPETVAVDLKAGLTGTFVCNARPEESLHCVVTRIEPSSEARDGKNVFVAEATVEKNPQWMRAGMEGVATIEVGNRPLWWVCLHRLIDALRLGSWL
jgi:biotin carboxyl carrier protein